MTSDSRADVQPTWSAKGRIIFVRQAGPGGTGDLFSIRPDGTDEFRLTNDSINDVAPTASPEGDQVAWERPESGWDIVTMNVDGTGGMTNLTATTDGNALSPDWSADGTQIAFHLFFFPFGPNDTDVYTVGVDCGSPVNVTSTSGKPETNPLWAGDGSALLYQTGGSFETISLEGGGTVTPVSIAGASDWAVVRPLFFSPAWGGPPTPTRTSRTSLEATSSSSPSTSAGTPRCSANRCRSGATATEPTSVWWPDDLER